MIDSPECNGGEGVPLREGRSFITNLIYSVTNIFSKPLTSVVLFHFSISKKICVKVSKIILKSILNRGFLSVINTSRVISLP